MNKKEGFEIAQILREQAGQLAVVEKKRQLWIFGHTRIHLDRVKHLGNFVELETVINNISFKHGWVEHLAAKKALSLDKFTPVRRSYGDLILKKLNNLG